ncbi:MAG TPA: transglutaminase domain-containing protein [Burkholderiaceae bacterium]|nr:transglutaminase domain-containing protein [Burkholderiaceae bacterium]
MNRRQWMTRAVAGVAGASSWPFAAHAQSQRAFAPQPGAWRTFEMTTTVDVLEAQGATRVWLPLPAVDGPYQQSLGHQWSGNASSARIVADPHYGAAMLYAEFDPAIAAPRLAVTSTVRTRSRATDWQRPQRADEDGATLKRWVQPTELMPTDGIVLETARDAIGRAKSDEERTQRLYDWVVSHTYREPKVRGCGVGDIKTMLETANFGGKCGDINGLFVGLCRSVGIPARDVYGIRIAPSAFGYRELGGNPAKLQAAQHCRAEVWLQRHGWVAMDPADVGKVMRLETPEWIRDTQHPVVAPVNKALFGGWEGNWLAFNTAHDVTLPGSTYGKLGFFMYPQAENANGRYDALDADRFRYTITSRELNT